jgi:CrcB protein
MGEDDGTPPGSHEGGHRHPDAHGRPDELVGLDPEVEPAVDATHGARPTPAHAVLVFCGGALGVLGRDLLLRAAPAPRDAIPWMLVALNVAGAAALGILVARLLEPRPGATSLRLFLATGVLGGFTTYSSLVAAAVVAGHDGQLAHGFVTLLGTAAAGAVAALVAIRARPRGAVR